MPIERMATFERPGAATVLGDIVWDGDALAFTANDGTVYGDVPARVELTG